MCFRNFPDGWLCDIWFLSSAWAVTTSSFSHLFSDFALNREGFSLVAEAYLRLDFPVIPQWQAYISNRDRVLLRLNFLKNKKTKQSKKNPVNSWHFITPPLVKKKKKVLSAFALPPHLKGHHVEGRKCADALQALVCRQHHITFSWFWMFIAFSLPSKDDF